MYNLSIYKRGGIERQKNHDHLHDIHSNMALPREWNKQKTNSEEHFSKILDTLGLN